MRFLHIHQVFKDTTRLTKFLMLRKQYVIGVLDSALQIESFTLQCNGVINRDQLTQTLAALRTQGSGRPELLHKQLLFYDLAQSVTTWPGAWSDLIMTPLADIQQFVLDRVPVLQGMSFAEESTASGDALKFKLRSYLPSLSLGGEGGAEGVEPGKDGDEHQQDEGRDSKKAAAADPSTSVLTVDSILRFVEGPTTLMALDDSMDAFLLKMGDFDVSFVSMLQHKLQFLLWSIYSSHLRTNEAARMVAVDLSKKSTDAVLITKELVQKQGFEMFMAGTVSVHPQGTLGKDCYPLCCLFGIQFYVNAPKDLCSLDCVVPAWCTKPVSRNDLAYFHVVQRDIPVIMHIAATGAEASPHVQLAKDVPDKLKSIMAIQKAFAELSQAEKDTVVADSENLAAMDGEAEGIQIKTPWHQRTPGEVRALTFSLRPLRPHYMHTGRFPYTVHSY